jgi:thermopsin
MNSKKIVTALVIAVALVMIMSSLAVFTYGGGVSSTPNPTSSSATAGTNSLANSVKVQQVAGLGAGLTSLTASQKAAKIMSSLKSAGIPTKDIYLPNFASDSHLSNGLVTPGYLTSPAPMGIGSYGVYNNSTGHMIAYGYSTNSVKASVSLNSLSILNAMNDGPHEATFQLNAILNNVYIQGQPGFQFWNQNVVFYSQTTHSLEFLDNVWNFSSPAVSLQPGSILSGTGTAVLPVYYYSVGPTIHVTFPFSFTLYLNTTVVNGNDATFFNYSVHTGSKTMSGSYDEVIYNSVGGMPPTFNAPPASYVVNGSQVSDTGFIPMDAEIMVGGPGGGSTANIMNISGSMTLNYMNATGEYVAPASAYDFGSETGETSTGVAVSSTSPGTANLITGPSILYQLWNSVNVSNPSDTKSLSTVHYAGSINPSNAFLFVEDNNNTFQNSSAVWAPLNATTGGFSFTLQKTGNVTGSFSDNPFGVRAAYALSDFTPAYNISLPTTVTMSYSSSAGIYTPLYAFTVPQLKNISKTATGGVNGKGTSVSPFILDSNGGLIAHLLPEFAEVNDYSFPVFSGIYLYHVNNYTTISQAPMFQVQYKGFYLQTVMFFGLQATNFLGSTIENSSNITVENSIFGGWLNGPDITSTFPTAASLILWNTTNSVITNNGFVGLNVYSLSIYNGHMTPILTKPTYFGSPFISEPIGNITIEGNTFTTGGAYGVGLGLFSSINFVTGNIFTATTPVISPPTSIYTGGPVGGYLDLGYMNAFDQGTNGTGNYWWNFNGQIPYTDNGLIYGLDLNNPSAAAGDYYPLNAPVAPVSGYYPVTFTEHNLPSHTYWGITIDNLEMMPAMNTNQSTITMFLPNGTYQYTANASMNDGFNFIPVTSNTTNPLLNNVSFTVRGKPISVPVTFNKAYNVYINVTGLPANVFWQATITPIGKNATANGTSETELGLTQTNYVEATGNIVPTSPEANGTYSYSVMLIGGNSSYILYSNVSAHADNLTGMITVNGSTVNINIHFHMTMNIFSFMQTTLPEGTPWSVTLSQTNSTGAVVFTSTVTSTGMYANLTAPNGTYNYSVSVGSQYREYSYQIGQSNVSATSLTTVTKTVSFVPVYGIDFYDSQSLMPGQVWSVTIGSMTVSSNFTDAYFALPENSTAYSYTITAPSGYHVNDSLASGSVNLASGSKTVMFMFVSNPVYKVTFTESGLASGTAWSVTLNGQTVYSTTDTIVFLEMNGTYTYSVNNVTSYSAPSSATGSVTVNGAAQSVSTTYSTTVSTPLNPYLIIAIIAIVLIVIIGVAYLYIGRPRKPKQ